MQLLRLLLLLLGACVATVAVAEGGTSSVEGKTRRNNPGNLKTESQDDGKTGSFGSEENEERVMTSVSKVKGVFGVNKAGLSTKLAGVRKNPGVVAALGRNPAVKKIWATIAKDPDFLTKLEKNPEATKKLANNPDLQKAAATLEKAGVKVSESDISKIKAAAAIDPTKAIKAKGGVGFVDRVVIPGLGAVMIGVPAFMLVLTIITIIRRYVQ